MFLRNPGQTCGAPPSPSKPDSYPKPFSPTGWASAPLPQPDVHLSQPF